MQQPLEDPWLDAYTISLLSASLVTWVFLISVKVRRGWILPYEPRRPVPWGPLGGLLAIVFVCVALLTSSGAEGEPEPVPDLPNPIQTVEGLANLIFSELILVGSALAAIALISRANLRDLGLPVYADEALSDVRIGVVAFLAALAPVFGLKALLTYLLTETDDLQQNPLIEMVLREPHVGVMFLATIAAVVVAPVCEEIIFRLLLQGWLEKWGDRRRDEPDVRITDDHATPDLHTPASEAMVTPRSDETAGDDYPGPPGQTASSEALPPNEEPMHDPPGRPYGLLPILGSSLLFALAHFGYGTDPVPIFVLALILGYVYQRTHRIVPCIVMHALFNLVTMLTLWWLLKLHFE